VIKLKHFISILALVASLTMTSQASTALAFGYDQQVLQNLSDLPTDMRPPRYPIPRPSRCPNQTDLIVLALPAPEWDSVQHETIIRATVENIGGIMAAPFDILLREGTTIKYQIVRSGLATFSTASVEFRLPYWVYHPDVYFAVTVNPSRHEKNECNFNNNTQIFQGIGR
jgi:hypothetical protein